MMAKKNWGNKMQFTRYFKDIKKQVNEENNRVMALLWLIETTLLINIII